MTLTSMTRAATRGRSLQDLYRRRRPLGVHARVAALEKEAAEARQLDRRVAELTEIVAELLAPVADREDARMGEVLGDYRERM